MVESILDSLKKLWYSWNVRGSILLSFGLQAVLVFCAPLRKQTANNFVLFSIWLAYLLADWVAGFTVGLISSRQPKAPIPTDEKTSILVFWASFLLIHLGGPDTITAFNLEDNELWMRQFLGLAAQIGTAGYIYIQSISHNRVWIPTLLLLVAGVVKYIERIGSLRFASKDNVRQSIMTRDKKRTAARDEIMSHNFLTGCHHLDIVRFAKRYHDTMKGLLVDVLFDPATRIEGRAFFWGTTAEDALQVIAVELNLIYGALFTKISVVHSVLGCIFRVLTLILEIFALAWFYFKVEKKALDKYDKGITYILLLGGILLEFVALFKLIFSDWTAAKLKSMKPIVKATLDCFFSWKSLEWESGPSLSAKHKVLATPTLFRRWSESISKFNLLAYCLKKSPQSISKQRRFSGNSSSGSGCFGDRSFLSLQSKILKISEHWEEMLDKTFELLSLKGLVDKWRYLSSEPLRKELWEFIFLELREKSENAIEPEDVLKICSARGELVIQKWDFQHIDSTNENNTAMKNALQFSVTTADYNRSIIVWHIATDLCYYTEDNVVDDPGQISNTDCRDFSKIISDYMLYLLIMQPALMSAVAGIAQIRFMVTCDELKWILKNEPIQKEVQMTSEYLLATNRLERLSLIHDARELAETLKRMKDAKWQLMSKVWVEMLSYAACHCEASAHVQQLSKGGELLAFVWLLMAHLGFVNPSLLTQKYDEQYWELVHGL